MRFDDGGDAASGDAASGDGGRGEMAGGDEATRCAACESATLAATLLRRALLAAAVREPCALSAAGWDCIFLAAVPRAAAASCAGERFFGGISKLRICWMRVETANFGDACSIDERVASGMARAWRKARRFSIRWAMALQAIETLRKPAGAMRSGRVATGAPSGGVERKACVAAATRMGVATAPPAMGTSPRTRITAVMTCDFGCHCESMYSRSR